MAKQGRAGEALTTAFTVSFLGAFVAVLLITFLSPLVASFALQFGPAEFFAVYLLAFCSFVGMSKASPFKTIASMMLGFALASVGLDIVSGKLRLTFGSTELMRGFDFLVAVIGLFGIGEILLVDGGRLAFQGGSAKLEPEGRAADLEEAAALLGDAVRSARDRLLDGHDAGRRHAGLVHELRPRQALLPQRRQVRHRRARRRDGAGDRRPCRRHQRHCCRC